MAHAQPPRPLDWGLSMGLGVPPFAAHRFSTRPDVVAGIRQFVAQTLLRWDLRGCLDDTLLVANELVANAVLHARTQQGEDMGWLGLANTRYAVLCTVSDASPRPAVVRKASLLSDTGRGLWVVQALSETWGCVLRADGSGKTVWARIPN